jgi:hypothetical protein
MKTLASILLGFLFIISAETVRSQTRSANPPKFFIGGYRAQFDNGDTSLAQSLGLLGATNDRYTNMEPQDDSLGLNCEDREFYDNPSQHPAPDSIVLGGKSDLDVLILQPFQLFHACQNTFYTRFEFERHQLQSPANEYTGFLDHSGLIGRNDSIPGATSPAYLIGTSRATDSNALVLDTAIDAAGVFADSMWHNALFEGATFDHPYFGYNRYGVPINQKMLLRMRVKVTQNVDTTHPPILCIVTRTEKCHLRDANGQFIPNSYALRLTHIDTIVVNSQFKHINSDFDLIDLRFKRDYIHAVDSTTAMYFSFYWPKKVSAVFDYMELMTAHINSTDNPGSLGWDHPPSVSAGEASAYSAEDFLDPNPVELGKLVSRIKTHYLGHVNYIRMGDEFPLGTALPLKRLAKLIHDSTGGQIEMSTLEVDSGSWSDASFGIAPPHVYDFESARLGWVNDSMYYDEKMVFSDPYVIQDVALPKRTTASDSANTQIWENTFAPVKNLDTPQKGRHYTRDSYLTTIQSEYHTYLNANRHLRRWTERQHNGSHYGIDWQDYTTVVTDSIFLEYDGSRPPTGPEMKVTGHLAVSNGAAGLFLYPFVEPPPGNVGGLYGGTVLYDGTHDSNYYSTSVQISSSDTTKIHGRLWLGFKERFDTLQKLLPLMKIYGSELIDDTCLGDWTAAELPNAPSGTQSMLPFVFNSMVALDDSGKKDLLVKNDSATNVVDTSNRTLVHISMWLDKDSTAKARHQDTLLYIINMRSDDSYDSTGVPSSIDRRFITMKFKRAHIIQDVADTNGGQLDNGKIWTPYVDAGAGDSLKLQLLAGDGILIRLLDTVYGISRPTRIAINFPKGSDDFNDKGRVKFDRPVAGAKNKTNDWSIPSTHKLYSVGIPDTSHAQLWQDSLLYQRVDSTSNSRNGYWRNQNWTEGSTVPGITFNFKRQLLPTTAGRRDAQISTDSIAHKIVITTDFEGTRDSGKVRLVDPFLVDSLTLVNVMDTLPKVAPFVPFKLSSNRGAGVDSEHYGGIFLLQNPTRRPTLPIYTLNAFDNANATFQMQDTMPTEWVFINWVTNDTIVYNDINPWQGNPNPFDQEYPLWNYNKSTQVVFGKDSAVYTARYKAHMAAFSSASDSGFLWNNQRKFYYLTTDTSGKKWYRIVYSSNGRIFTALGSKSGSSAIVWKPEQLVSEWDDPRAEYPAMGLHIDTLTVNDTTCTFVYQTTESDGTSEIKIAKFIDNIPIVLDDLNQNSDGSDIGAAPAATPAIYSVEGKYGRLDVVAWASPNGIVVKAIGALGSGDSTGHLGSEVRTDGNRSNPEFIFGDSNAVHPTIWVDTCYICGNDSSVHLVTLAWQQDTTMTVSNNRHQTPSSDSTFTDILAVQFDVVYSKMYPYIKFYKHPGLSLRDTDVSFALNPNSYTNRNPCISGTRLDANNSLQRLAYESTEYNGVGSQAQGIQVARIKTGAGWVSTKYFLTSDTLHDKYTKPTIEVSHYFDSSGHAVSRNFWYSLAYERANGANTQHWAMQENTQRVAPATFTGVSNPQLAVVKPSIDDLGDRIGFGGPAPKTFASSTSALFKLGANDTLWGYHFVIESDSTHGLNVQQGIGELSVDDGLSTADLELEERTEDEIIDSSHTAGYFMQSQPFTLPASGYFSYFRWIVPSVDSLKNTGLDTISYALDFYDTTGSFVCRLDSLLICDSINKTFGTATVALSRDASQKGFVQFHRLTSSLTVSDAKWISAIRQARMSSPTSNKHQAKPTSGLTLDDIVLTADPNPAKGDITVGFSIPYDGGVAIEVYNQLGQLVSQIAKPAEFHQGLHKIVWHPGSIPSGPYYLRLYYGNLQKVLRVIYYK